MSEAGWHFGVESGVSLFDQTPFVNIIIDGESRQVPPEKAREMAGMLLSCAEASVQEAVLFKLVSDSGKDKEAGAAMIMALRQMRGPFETEE